MSTAYKDCKFKRASSSRRAVAEHPASLTPAFRPRTCTTSVASDMSTLDRGIRGKPCCSQLTLKEELQDALGDVHRLLEFIQVLVEENAALKSILKERMVSHGDGNANELCESLINAKHEVPTLKSLRSRCPRLQGDITAVTAGPDQDTSNIGSLFRAAITHKSFPHIPTTAISAPRIPAISPKYIVAENTAEACGHCVVQTLDAASSIRKLASLTHPERWKAGKQEATSVDVQKEASSTAPALESERQDHSLRTRSKSQEAPIPSHIPIEARSFKTVQHHTPKTRVEESIETSVPRFYTKDLLPIIEERNSLKEQVLQLEDELEEVKAVALSYASFGGSVLSQTIAVRDEATSTARTPQVICFRPVIGANECYITDVSVVGCKKRKGNCVYMIQTTWSDRNRYEIYRRYGEFFTFQNTLLQLFPAEAGKYRSSERILPTLPTIDNVLRILGRTNSTTVLTARLQTIDSYCQTLLLRLDTTISRSGFVISFFKPYPGDKQLERLERPRGETLVLSVYPQNIPAGSVFGEHIVLADYEASNGNELTVKTGDIVKVIIKEDSGWYLVSANKPVQDDADTSSGEQLGYVPGSFLKWYEGPNELQTTLELQEKHLGFISSIAMEEINPSLMYVAIEDYTTDDPRQISFTRGTVLIVVEKEEDGWWLVTHEGKEGWAPSSYLEPVDHNGRMEEDGSESEPSAVVQSYITVEAYRAQLEDELSFGKDTTVEVIEKSVTGWWTIRCGGKVGIAPASFLSALASTPSPCGPKQFSLSMDLGHSISGIHQPPPRRQLLQRKRAMTAIEEEEIFFLEQPEQGRNMSDTESELFCRKLAGTKEGLGRESTAMPKLGLAKPSSLAGTKEVLGRESTAMSKLKPSSFEKPYQTLPASRKVSRPADPKEFGKHSEKKEVGIDSEEFAAAAAEEQPSNSTFHGPGSNFPTTSEDEIGLGEEEEGPKLLCSALQCKLITKN